MDQGQQDYVLQAKAVIRREQMMFEHYSDIRDKANRRLGSKTLQRGDSVKGSEPHGLSDLIERDRAVTEVRRREPILKMKMIDVAKAIDRRHKEIARSSWDKDRGVKLGFYTYKFTTLERLSEKYQDEESQNH